MAVFGTVVSGFEDQKHYVGAKRHHIAENNDPFFWFIRTRDFKIYLIPVKIDLLRFEVTTGRPNPEISRDSRDCLAAGYNGSLYFYDVKCSETLGVLCQRYEGTAFSN